MKIIIKETYDDVSKVERHGGRTNREKPRRY